MDFLLAGFILLFFDLNLNLGIISIGILPEFIGWILIGKGVKELEFCDELFDLDKLKLCINIAAVVSAVTYIIKLTGMRNAMSNIWNLNIWIRCFDIAWVIFTAIIIFTLIRLVIKEAEINMDIGLMSQELEITYVVIFVCKLIVCVVGFVPELAVIAVIATVAVIVADIVFLFLMYKARKKYQYYE